LQCGHLNNNIEYILARTWIYVVYSDFRWDVVVRFVDIVGIVAHHSLNFRFSK